MAVDGIMNAWCLCNLNTWLIEIKCTTLSASEYNMRRMWCDHGSHGMPIDGSQCSLMAIDGSQCRLIVSIDDSQCNINQRGECDCTDGYHGSHGMLIDGSQCSLMAIDGSV